MGSIIEIKNLYKSFIDSQKRAVLSDISFSLEEGKVACIVGPSGAGKSTLLRCIAGLEHIDKGEIILLGEHKINNQDSYNALDLKGKVSFVFQDYNLWPHKTVLENIVMAPILLKRMSKEKATGIAYDLLKRFDLYEKKDEYPDFLSGGQRQRVAIIRAIASQPKLLLLDEITSALDPELISSVLNLIKIIVKEGQTMIVVTHDIKFATEIADQIIFLDNGHLVQNTSSQDFIYSQKDKRINEFLQNINVHHKDITIYEGYDQFQAYQLGVIKRAKRGSAKCVVGSTGDRWFEAMGSYYDDYEKARVEKEISWRMIMYNESKFDKEIRLKYPKLNEYRLIPKNVENPANYYVLDDVVVIQIFGDKNDEPVVIEIRNKSAVKSYMNYFDLLWERSKPIK